MKITIDWVSIKNEDWKEISLTRESGDKLTEVSVNRKSKKGEVFPNFDELAAGQTIEGELWQSPAGKWYLFPPRPVKQASSGAYKQKVMEEAVARKETSIKQFQGSKEYSIKVSSTFRAAVDSAIAEYQEMRRVSIAVDANLEKLFEKWREYYWFTFDVDDKTYPPFK